MRWAHRDCVSSLSRARRERVVPNRRRTSGEDGASGWISCAERVTPIMLKAGRERRARHGSSAHVTRTPYVATSTQISTDMFVTRWAVLRAAANWTQTSQPRLGCHLWLLRRRHRGKNQLIMSRRGTRSNAGDKECKASRVLFVEQAAIAGGTNVDTGEAHSRREHGGGGCDRKRDFRKELCPEGLL